MHVSGQALFHHYCHTVSNTRSNGLHHQPDNDGKEAGNQHSPGHTDEWPSLADGLPGPEQGCHKMSKDEKSKFDFFQK